VNKKALTHDTTKVDIKKHGLETSFDVIVSDCALKSLVFGTRIPKSNKAAACSRKVSAKMV